MENQDNNKIDWNDDSGEIHTVYQKYETSSEDGFQRNHAYINRAGKKNRYIKGKQIGFKYVTDDYRKVLPGYVFATILIIAVTIILFFINVITGIVFGVFAAFFIYGFWKSAPITKWKNQSKKIKSEKNNR